MLISSRSVLSVLGLVRLRQPLELLLVGPEGRVLHAERLEQALVQELLVGHAADDLDDAAGRVDAGVGVLVLACPARTAAASWRSSGPASRSGSRSSVGCSIADANGRPLVWLRISRTVIGCFGCLSSTWSVVALDRQPLALELRQVFLHRVVELHLALVHEHHQGGGGDRLRLRGDPEQGVGASSASWRRRRRKPTASRLSTLSLSATSVTAPARAWLSTNGCSAAATRDGSFAGAGDEAARRITTRMVRIETCDFIGEASRRQRGSDPRGRRTRPVYAPGNEAASARMRIPENRAGVRGPRSAECQNHPETESHRRSSLMSSSCRSAAALLAAATLLPLGVPGPAPAADGPPAGKSWVYVGTYTGKDSKGIYRCEFDPATGKLSEPDPGGRDGQPDLPRHPPERQVPLRRRRDRQLRRQEGRRRQRLRHRPEDRRFEAAQPAVLRRRRAVLHQSSTRRARTCWSPTTAAAASPCCPSRPTAGSASPPPSSSTRARRRQGPAGGAARPLDQPRRRPTSFAFVADLGLDKVLVYRSTPTRAR